MYPVSQAFLAAVRNGARRLSVADVYYGGVFIRTLPIADGRVQLDRSSLIMGSGTMTVGSSTLIPKFANSSLAPYAIEIRIRTGFQFSNGWTEMVPLGIFRLQNTNWTEAGGEIPNIEFFDRFQAIQEAGFLTPVDRSGYTIKSTLATFIKDIFPNANITFCSDPIELLFPGGTIFQESRADAIQTCLTALGQEGHFDEVGDYFVHDVPGVTQTTPLTDAVYTIAPGEDGTLADAVRGVTRDGLINGVTCYGATTEAGVQYVGQAFDTDPQSPTYIGSYTLNMAGIVDSHEAKSQFGMATTQITNDSLTSNQQCIDYAKAYLRDHNGVSRSLEVTCASNPALRPGDTIMVKFLSGLAELHVIDSMSIPLVGGDMTITTRSVTYQFGIGDPDTDGGEEGPEDAFTWSDLTVSYTDWEDLKDQRASWGDVLLYG